MAKDFLAFMGLVFLTILIIIGVVLMGGFYDQIGIISLPEGLRETASSYIQPEMGITVQPGVGEAQWSNPLDLLPTATPEPLPTVEPTPIPPLAPEVYRTEVVLRLKTFAGALEHWLDANQRLSEDDALLEDPVWQAEVKSALNEVASSALVMASVGPAPRQYASIDGWLDRVAYEAASLQSNYATALAQHERGESGEKQFRAAGENFTRIKEYLTQAVTEMVAQGWSLE